HRPGRPATDARVRRPVAARLRPRGRVLPPALGVRGDADHARRPAPRLGRAVSGTPPVVHYCVSCRHPAHGGRVCGARTFFTRTCGCRLSTERSVTLRERGECFACGHETTIARAGFLLTHVLR